MSIPIRTPCRLRNANCKDPRNLVVPVRMTRSAAERTYVAGRELAGFESLSLCFSRRETLVNTDLLSAFGRVRLQQQLAPHRPHEAECPPLDTGRLTDRCEMRKHLPPSDALQSTPVPLHALVPGAVERRRARRRLDSCGPPNVRAARLPSPQQESHPEAAPGSLALAWCESDH